MIWQRLLSRLGILRIVVVSYGVDDDGELTHVRALVNGRKAVWEGRKSPLRGVAGADMFWEDTGQSVPTEIKSRTYDCLRAQRFADLEAELAKGEEE